MEIPNTVDEILQQDEIEKTIDEFDRDLRKDSEELVMICAGKGKITYICTSMEVSRLLWLLERTKALLMSEADEDEIEPPQENQQEDGRTC